MEAAGPYWDVVLQQKSADLVDDGGTVVHEAVPDSVKCLDVELLGVLHGYEPHCRPRDGFGDGLGVVEIVLAGFQEWANELGGYDPGLMSLCDQAAGELL